MDIVTDTKTLKKRLAGFKKEPFVTLDTEFMRERTYYPILCLVQIAGAEDFFAIDAMAEGLDLTPLFELLDNKKIVKVFHAMEQDIEIMYRLTGHIPSPLFDTQVAAQVLGYGEAVGYGTLVKRICDVEVDKTSRFTDWSHRPLSEKQVDYALTDVTYLRNVCEHLLFELESKKRMSWFLEEMEVRSNPDLYETHPEDAWQKFKVKNARPEFYGILQAVAEWREKKAQDKDVPKRRVIRDETVLELAASQPTDEKQLDKLRHVHPSVRRDKKMVKEMLDAVKNGLKHPVELERRKAMPPDTPLVDLLKVLLKQKCEEHGVARKLLANEEDLRWIAALNDKDLKEKNVNCMQGWRFEVFGKAAIALKKGKLAMAAKGKNIELLDL
jgi:ribonuclease D